MINAEDPVGKIAVENFQRYCKTERGRKITTSCETFAVSNKEENECHERFDHCVTYGE
jgi:hypothetical protein